MPSKADHRHDVTTRELYSCCITAQRASPVLAAAPQAPAGGNAEPAATSLV